MDPSPGTVAWRTGAGKGMTLTLSRQKKSLSLRNPNCKEVTLVEALTVNTRLVQVKGPMFVWLKMTFANVIFNQTNMGPFTWTNLVFTVKASTNVTSLQFGFRNDNDFFCLDNVSVMPLPAPVLQATVPGDGSIQLAWTALAGAAYQVQYQTNLAQTGWIDLGGVLTATSNPMIYSQSPVSGPARFYRVLLLP